MWMSCSMTLVILRILLVAGRMSFVKEPRIGRVFVTVHSASIANIVFTTPRLCFCRDRSGFFRAEAVSCPEAPATGALCKAYVPEWRCSGSWMTSWVNWGSHIAPQRFLQVLTNNKSVIDLQPFDHDFYHDQWQAFTHTYLYFEYRII